MSEGLRRPASHPAPGVAERLEGLRATYVPEGDANAGRRPAAQPDAAAEAFAAGVARRLEELRALCDLAQHLHRRR
jgi:hypothetical protein